METEETPKGWQAIKKIINEYFDGELDKEKEVFLFTSLSQNEEAREYFKSMNILKSTLNETNEDVPFELEERIFHSMACHPFGVDKSTTRKFFTARNIFMFGSYAAAIILIIVSIFLFNQVNDYKNEVKNAVKIINAKNENLELLLNNTLPAAEVRGKFIGTKYHYLKEIIIKSN